MRRLLVTATAALAMVSFTASATLASSVHLKQFANPTFTDNGLTLNATGNLAGLGNGDVLVLLPSKANPTATCGNPSTFKQQAPGQNPASVDVTGSQAIPNSQLKNGNTPFDVTTDPPVTPVVGAPDCPNSSWTETITDMAFTQATVVVEQPAGPLPTQTGPVVFTTTCTFSKPTSDGLVPAKNVSCS